MTRRELLGSIGAFAAGAVVSKAASCLHSPKPFSFAFMTDLHVSPVVRCSSGLLRLARLVAASEVDLVITGGDLARDALRSSRDEATEDFRAAIDLLETIGVPVRHCIGNHDAFGWHPESPADERDPLYGKAMWRQFTGQRETYYSFEAGGLKVAVLDSITQDGRGWKAEIQEEQLHWLSKQRPDVVISHVPIVSRLPGITNPAGDWVLRNPGDVLPLIRGATVLQGHTHVGEDFRDQGCRFISAGSGCGEWWRGPRLGKYAEGFLLCEVDGRGLSTRYVSLGLPETAQTRRFVGT